MAQALLANAVSFALANGKHSGYMHRLKLETWWFCSSVFIGVVVHTYLFVAAIKANPFALSCVRGRLLFHNANASHHFDTVGELPFFALAGLEQRKILHLALGIEEGSGDSFAHAIVLGRCSNAGSLHLDESSKTFFVEYVATNLTESISTHYCTYSHVLS